LLLAAVAVMAAALGCEKSDENQSGGILRYPSFRDVPGITAGEIAEIESLVSSREKFTYGALFSTEAFKLPDGSLAGFAKDFCELALSELFGADFEVELYESRDELIEDFESGNLDFIGALPATDELRDAGYIITLPIAERMIRIFTPLESGIKSESDIEGLKIGFLAGSFAADKISEKYRLSFDRVYVAGYGEAAKMIESGEIDAFVEEASADPFFDKEEYGFVRSRFFFRMSYVPVSMAAKKPELSAFISAISKYVESAGIDDFCGLYKNGDFEYARYKLSKSLSSEERAYIDDLARRGAAVSVGFEHDNYPIVFFNEKDGQFEGIAVDVLNEITRLTGMAFEPAASENAKWAEIYEKFDAGEISMVAQLLQSEARSAQFFWSKIPYARSYYALMSKADYPNLGFHQVAYASVGAMKKSAKYDMFHELFPEHGEISEYDTQFECLDALGRGEIDILVASEYMLLTQINYREESGFKINIKLDVPLDSHFGFHESEPVLRSIIDKAQEYVDTGSIEISWTGRNFDYSKKLAAERMHLYEIFIFFILLVLTAIIFVLAKNVKLGKRLKEIASHDALTGIFNKRFFMEQAAIQVARSLRTGHECFIAIFDLDHFKAVNDTYGHLAGDKVLKELAQTVKNTIRPYDLFGRYGGEEFIILMCDINRENVFKAAERIRMEIFKTSVEFDGKDISVSASFGVACAIAADDLMEAAKQADEALYRAKKEGRNRVVLSD